MSANENSKLFALGDDEMDAVTGGGDAGLTPAKGKCPSFVASAYAQSILNNPRASGTAKSAIQADLGRCSKCAISGSCPRSDDEKRAYGGSFWG